MVMTTVLAAAMGSELVKVTVVEVTVGVAGMSAALPLTVITCREAANSVTSVGKVMVKVESAGIGMGQVKVRVVEVVV